MSFQELREWISFILYQLECLLIFFVLLKEVDAETFDCWMLVGLLNLLELLFGLSELMREELSDYCIDLHNLLLLDRQVDV